MQSVPGQSRVVWEKGRASSGLTPELASSEGHSPAPTYLHGLKKVVPLINLFQFYSCLRRQGLRGYVTTRRPEDCV